MRPGIGTAKTVRKWIRRAEIDVGGHGRITTAESERPSQLMGAVAEIKHAHTILKAVSASFAAEPGRPGAWSSVCNRAGAGRTGSDAQSIRLPLSPPSTAWSSSPSTYYEHGDAAPTDAERVD